MGDVSISFTTDGPCPCCGCQLPIPYSIPSIFTPNDTSPYASLSAAESAFSRTGDCSIFKDYGNGWLDFVSFSATTGPGTFNVTASNSEASVPPMGIGGGIFVIKIANLTTSNSIGYHLLAGAVNLTVKTTAYLIDESGSVVASDFAIATGPFDVTGAFSIPIAGDYSVAILCTMINETGGALGGVGSYSAEISFAEDAQLCTMSAEYTGDDGVETVGCVP